MLRVKKKSKNNGTVFTYNPGVNPYANKNESSQKLDYIFSTCNEENFIKAICEEVVFTKQNAVSDHCGLKAQFKIFEVN
jgi:hypothetical protein